MSPAGPAFAMQSCRAHLLLLFLCILACTLPLASSQCSCGPPPPLPPVVRIALVGQCSASTPVGKLDQSFLFHPTCIDESTPQIIKGYLLGAQFFMEKMLARQPLRLRDNSSVSFSFSFLNIGPTALTPGEADAQMKLMGNSSGGFFLDALTTSVHGGPYPLVVPSLASDLSIALANVCEDTQSCVAIHPFSSDPPTHLCLDNPSLPVDCARHHRVDGTRRFDFLLGILPDQRDVASSALHVWRQEGVRRIAILGDSDHFYPFADAALSRTVQLANQLNIEVVSAASMVPCDQALGNCPRDKEGKYPPLETMVLPDGLTPLSYSQHLKNAGVEAIVFLLSAWGGLLTTSQIFEAFKTLRWTPRAIMFGGGGDADLPLYLADSTDLHYTYSTAAWDPRLSGPDYRNVETGANLELLPASGTMDGPAVFAREFNAWAPRYLNGATWSLEGGGASNLLPVLGWQALNVAQKLVETALTADAPSLAAASTRVSVPSVFHLMQFDVTGRTQRVEPILLQRFPAPAGQPVANFAHVIIAPLNIGEEPLFPIPTWEERVFNPVQYAEPLEKMMAAITAVCIAACIILAALVILHARHAVIRAATPSFCLLTILGAIVMLVSNFFHTRVESDSHCAAQVWLLSLGFTMLFSALFIKTFRIWKIFFSSRKLSVVKMKDRDLLLAVAAFLLVDVIINAAWAGVTGQPSRVRVIDPHRPALNIVECDYTDAEPFIFAHIATKGALLLFGICLTYAVRNTPSQFNESTFIAIAIYNVSVLICFILPILAVHIGGRDNYLVRALSIVFVSLSTVGILYVPKLRQVYGQTAFVSSVVTSPTHVTSHSPHVSTVIKSPSKGERAAAVASTHQTPAASSVPTATVHPASGAVSAHAAHAAESAVLELATSPPGVVLDELSQTASSAAHTHARVSSGAPTHRSAMGTSGSAAGGSVKYHAQVHARSSSSSHPHLTSATADHSSHAEPLSPTRPACSAAQPTTAPAVAHPATDVEFLSISVNPQTQP